MASYSVTFTGVFPSDTYHLSRKRRVESVHSSIVALYNFSQMLHCIEVGTLRGKPFWLGVQQLSSNFISS